LNPGEERVFIVGVEGEGAEIGIAKLDMGVFDSGPSIGVTGEDGWRVSWGVGPEGFRVCARASGAEVEWRVGLINKGERLSQSSLS
jgi:hypothetical protein